MGKRVLIDFGAEGSNGNKILYRWRDRNPLATDRSIWTQKNVRSRARPVWAGSHCAHRTQYRAISSVWPSSTTADRSSPDRWSESWSMWSVSRSWSTWTWSWSSSCFAHRLCRSLGPWPRTVSGCRPFGIWRPRICNGYALYHRNGICFRPFTNAQMYHDTISYR